MLIKKPTTSNSNFRRTNMKSIKTQMMTNSDCYKAGRTITVKGLMLHSTGANNPKLSRYIGPDDGLLGKNPNNNDWNRPGIDKGVHGWIGLDKNGDVQAYRTLPWEHRGWHAGGSANNTHIGIEICEDDLKNAVYFNKVYTKAVELFAHLCRSFDLTEKDIIDHSEGCKLGVASNHGDVMHWFPKHGKSMHTFRADVKAELEGVKKQPVVAVVTGASSKPAPVVKPTPAQPKQTSGNKTIEQLAREVIRGVHGSGRERMLSLGSKYAAVQQEVTRMMRSK